MHGVRSSSQPERHDRHAVLRRVDWGPIAVMHRLPPERNSIRSGGIRNPAAGSLSAVRRRMRFQTPGRALDARNLPSEDVKHTEAGTAAR
jgi:hypothetical protein